MAYILGAHGSTINRGEFMKKWNFLILILSLIFALIGCNSGNSEHSSNALSVTDSVKVNGRSISIEEINSGIKAVFCKDLYYYPDGSMKPFFNNTVEYELFFAPSNRSLPKIYMIVRVFNVQYKW